MKKKAIIILITMGLILLTGCGRKLYEETSESVNAFNLEAQNYNERIKMYNDAIESIENENSALSSATDAAQEMLDNKIPYESTVADELDNAIKKTRADMVSVPEKISEKEMLSVNENMEASELKDIKVKAESGKDEIARLTVPDVPEVPDYLDSLAELQKTQERFEESVRVMNQITAPSDQFVMERLEKIDSISKMAAVTEDHDPNGNLGKRGGYIGCVYFRDVQVNQEELYFDGDPEDPIDVGTDGGGAIEVYLTADDAKKREDYLAAFDGSVLASGSHCVLGTILIRISNELPASAQTELTDKIIQEFTRLE